VLKIIKDLEKLLPMILEKTIVEKVLVGDAITEIKQVILVILVSSNSLLSVGFK
jgi:hypothetical protein